MDIIGIGPQLSVWDSRGMVPRECRKVSRVWLAVEANYKTCNFFNFNLLIARPTIHHVICLQDPGRFRWSSGGTVTYTAWGQGEPSKQDGSCVSMQWWSDGLWYTADCNEQNYAICKITYSKRLSLFKITYSERLGLFKITYSEWLGLFKITYSERLGLFNDRLNVT